MRDLLLNLSQKAMKIPKEFLNHCRNERFTPKSEPKSNENPQKASKSLPHSEIYS